MRSRAGWLRWALFVVSMTLYALDIAGIFVNGRAGIGTDWSQLSFAMFPVMGILIAVRQPKHLMGWLFLAEGLASGLTAAGTELSILLITAAPGGRLDPAQSWAVLPERASVLLWVLFFVIILLFPDGRLPSPRWRPFAWLAAVVGLLGLMFIVRPEPIRVSPELLEVDNPIGIPALAAFAPLWGVVQVLTMITGLGCFLAPVLRYHGTSGVQRQQLKWLGAGTGFLVLWLAAYMLSLVLTLPPWLKSIIDTMGSVGAAVIPVLMGVAILKYRLYDIDLIIRRTLVYSVLTVTLALVYWGGVVSLQMLLRPLSGEGNDLAIVATTLLVAGLFFPLRRRIQAFIDRRFYRRKYDAAKTLAAFAEHVRDEVDLKALTGHLVQVVDETMHPEHASLWLRPTGGAAVSLAREEGG